LSARKERLIRQADRQTTAVDVTEDEDEVVDKKSWREMKKV